MSDQLHPSDPNDPVREALGLPNTLRQWRGHVGWSQEDLERASGVSQKTISDIEAGRKAVKPQDRTLEAFALAFSEALGLGYKTLLTDLKRARSYTPDSKVSDFAERLDNLLQGLSPSKRLFMEESLWQHFFAIKAALDNVAARSTKKSRRKE